MPRRSRQLPTVCSSPRKPNVPSYPRPPKRSTSIRALTGRSSGCRAVIRAITRTNGSLAATSPTANVSGVRLCRVSAEDDGVNFLAKNAIGVSAPYGVTPVRLSWSTTRARRAISAARCWRISLPDEEWQFGVVHSCVGRERIRLHPTRELQLQARSRFNGRTRLSDELPAQQLNGVLCACQPSQQ